MLSPQVKKKAWACLRLSEGFISTADVGDGSSEYEIRNAFSRAYYAFFHACYAHLLGLGIDPVVVKEIARDHGRLHSSMRQTMGKPFERYVRETYDRRRQSDYEPGWPVPAATVAQTELKQARMQFYWLLHTTRRTLA